MKKNISIILLLAFGLILAIYSILSNNIIVKSNDINYKVVKENYINKGIIIYYPQITNLNDNNMQKKINEIIKNDALKVINYYRWTDKTFNLEVNYEIKYKSANLLSIQYLGVGYVEGAAYPNNLFYTTNISLSRGVRLKLVDLVRIDKNLVNKFKNGKYKAWDSESDPELKHAIIDILNNISDDEIIKKFHKADLLDNMGTEEQCEVFSYLTKDSLGISIGVIHALGDHAEIEIEYKKIVNNLKIENEEWKNFSI